VKLVAMNTNNTTTKKHKTKKKRDESYEKKGNALQM
jgi:hypothetical protein